MAKRKNKKKAADPTKCGRCDGLGTVPIRKTDEKGGWLKERHKTHANGSEWCPDCKGSGKADET